MSVLGLSLGAPWYRLQPFPDLSLQDLSSDINAWVPFVDQACARAFGLRTRCIDAWLLRRTRKRVTLSLLYPVSIDVRLGVPRRSRSAAQGRTHGVPDGSDSSTGPHPSEAQG